MKRLSKEEIIEQRKQFPRVLVSDDKKNWHETILLFQHNNMDCTCVCDSDIDNFLNGEYFDTEYFTYWKHIPVKKQVPFEHGKEIDWDWKFKGKNTENVWKIHSITETGLYLKNMTYYSFDEVARIFELSKDNGQTWQFAGKEIEEEE